MTQLRGHELRIWLGSWFHNLGAAIEKTLSPYVVRLDLGILRRFLEADLSDLVGA